MFTVDRREAVRTTLLARAREDPRVVGAAITGSAASDAEDRWSDIDLFFGVADGAAVADVLGDWSDLVYGELGALHHFDLHSGLATYRAFLLADRLEVDLAFTPAARFGPLGAGAFRVVFGAPADRPAARPPTRRTSSASRGTTCSMRESRSSAATHGRPSTGSAACEIM
jgi:predicted nucleotidyltransferase